MSNEKLTALVERTTPALSDLLYDVPSGAPIGYRITLGNLLANAPSVTFANPHTFPSLTVSGSPLAVNLGAVAAPTALTVGDTSSATPRGLMSWQASNDTASAHLHMRKSRGTFAVPLTVAVADILGRVVYGGYDGTSYLEVASIRATVVGTVAATRIATKLELMTGTDAAPSVLTVALTLDQNQAATFAGAIIGTATQSLLNTVSTTVNFAGAATTLAMGAGAASSATLSFTTGIALNTAAITSNQTTVALLNVTPTTINAFGAATVINIGAAAALSTFLGQIAVTGGTVTTSKPIFTATQTWNAGAVTFTGMLLNVTDTASAAASLLLDLQVGGTSKLSITKVGNILAPSGSSSNAAYAFASSVNSGFAWSGSSVNLYTSGNIIWQATNALMIFSTPLRLANAGGLGFGPDVNSSDTFLARVSSGILSTTGRIKLLTSTIQLISTGAAATAGTATLVGGTVTVSTTAASATCIVVLTRKTSGGTIGTAITYTISAGTSFTINSDNVLDTSTFNWHIIETF